MELDMWADLERHVVSPGLYRRVGHGLFKSARLLPGGITTPPWEQPERWISDEYETNGVILVPHLEEHWPSTQQGPVPWTDFRLVSAVRDPSTGDVIYTPYTTAFRVSLETWNAAPIVAAHVATLRLWDEEVGKGEADDPMLVDEDGNIESDSDSDESDKEGPSSPVSTTPYPRGIEYLAVPPFLGMRCGFPHDQLIGDASTSREFLLDCLRFHAEALHDATELAARFIRRPETDESLNIDISAMFQEHSAHWLEWNALYGTAKEDNTRGYRFLQYLRYAVLTPDILAEMRTRFTQQKTQHKGFKHHFLIGMLHALPELHHFVDGTIAAAQVVWARMVIPGRRGASVGPTRAISHLTEYLEACLPTSGFRNAIWKGDYLDFRGDARLLYAYRRRNILPGDDACPWYVHVHPGLTERLRGTATIPIRQALSYISIPGCSIPYTRMPWAIFVRFVLPEIILSILKEWIADVAQRDLAQATWPGEPRAVGAHKLSYEDMIQEMGRQDMYAAGTAVRTIAEANGRWFQHTAGFHANPEVDGALFRLPVGMTRGRDQKMLHAHFQRDYPTKGTDLFYGAGEPHQWDIASSRFLRPYSLRVAAYGHKEDKERWSTAVRAIAPEGSGVEQLAQAWDQHAVPDIEDLCGTRNPTQENAMSRLPPCVRGVIQRHRETGVLENEARKKMGSFFVNLNYTPDQLKPVFEHPNNNHGNEVVTWAKTWRDRPSHKEEGNGGHVCWFVQCAHSPTETTNPYCCPYVEKDKGAHGEYSIKHGPNALSKESHIHATDQCRHDLYQATDTLIVGGWNDFSPLVYTQHATMYQK